MCEKCAMYEQKVYAKTFLVFFRENWRKKRASVQDKTEKVNKNYTFPDLWNYKPLSQTYGITSHFPRPMEFLGIF